MKASPPSHSDIQCKVKHHYLQEKSNRIGAQLLRRETADRHQISMIFRFSSNLEAPVENWRSSTSIARKGPPLPVYRPIGQIGSAPVCTPVTNAHPVCRLLLENKKNTHTRTTL